MVARPAMVYMLNESVKQVPYPQIVKPMLNQRTKHGKTKKVFYHMERQQHSSWTRTGEGKNFTIFDFKQDRTFKRSLAATYKWIEIRDLMIIPLPNENIGRILLRAWSKYQSTSLKKPEVFTFRSYKLVHKMQFKPDNKDLSDVKIQMKLASQLLSICFIRIIEAAEINLDISNIDYRNQTAIKCQSPKAKNSIEQHKIRRSGDPKVSPKSTLFTWLNHLYWHYGMDLEQIANLFWQTDGQPADKRRISFWLNSLLREIGIRGATRHLFKHAASTELARQGLETKKLNIFTHHSIFSTAACNYNIYAANAGINDITSQLVGSHSQSFATQSSSQQRGGAIERSDICSLPECYLQRSSTSMLQRNSIAEPFALSFNETLPISRRIEPTNNTRTITLMQQLDCQRIGTSKKF
ncbi:MAG: hypothetical protein EZS28_015631 [Streblomastix strix]|uniref:Tyr recombinase domain-containing protein n=1 Tax=Streblomastix strix TaxID=222440 RepID=A0A5J4W2B3_9EUKA|nr:MAG: hypothetical protein EZS28_015631 [Streblomastix strix]